MTVAALPPGATHVTPLPVACGEHADAMGRLAERAKEDVVPALLGALRGVAVAITVCVQRLQVLQEEAAAGGGEVFQSCSKERRCLPEVLANAQGPGLPNSTNQVEEFLLEDGEDYSAAASSCEYDLEAVYDVLNSCDFRQAAALAGGDGTVEEVLGLIGAAGEEAVMPAALTPSLPATLGDALAVVEDFTNNETANRDAAKAAAADAASLAGTLGPVAEPSEPLAFPVALCDEVVCGRCGSSSSEQPGLERTSGPDYGWLCYRCLACCHREQGDVGHALLHDLWDHQEDAGPAAAQTARLCSGVEAGALRRPLAATGRPPVAEVEAAAEAAMTEVDAAMFEGEAAAGVAEAVTVEVAAAEAPAASEVDASSEESAVGAGCVEAAAKGVEVAKGEAEAATEEAKAAAGEAEAAARETTMSAETEDVAICWQEAAAEEAELAAEESEAAVKEATAGAEAGHVSICWQEAVADEAETAVGEAEAAAKEAMAGIEAENVAICWQETVADEAEAAAEEAEAAAREPEAAAREAAVVSKVEDAAIWLRWLEASAEEAEVAAGSVELAAGEAKTGAKEVEAVAAEAKVALGEVEERARNTDEATAALWLEVPADSDDKESAWWLEEHGEVRDAAEEALPSALGGNCLSVCLADEEEEEALPNALQGSCLSVCLANEEEEEALQEAAAQEALSTDDWKEALEELQGVWRPTRKNDWDFAWDANAPKTKEIWSADGKGWFWNGDWNFGTLKVVSMLRKGFIIEYVVESGDYGDLGESKRVVTCLLGDGTRVYPSLKRYFKRTEVVPQLPVDSILFAEQEWWSALRKRHAKEGPRARRGHSWPRTLAHGKARLAELGESVRKGSMAEPFQIWVLGATDQVEGALQVEGFWEEANFAGRAPTEVLLLGEQLQDLRLRDGLTGSFNHAATASCMSYKELARSRQVGRRLPDMVAVLMPGAEGQGLPPDDLLQALEEVPAVVSMRFELDEERLLKLKEKLEPGGRLLWKPTLCPFSSCPEGSASAFADNGWTLAVKGPGALKQLWTLAAPHTIPPGEPRRKDELQPACFWGILDIKYDTARPVLERVQVLETGDGKTSKFSGDGADLRRRYLEKYISKEDSFRSIFEVVAADKKLTHDLAEEQGYGHVLPKQASFERRYRDDLASDISSALGLSRPEDLVVLKLCNRTRGAGVCVTPVSTLDEVLRELLNPPRHLEVWFAKHAAIASRSGTHRLDLGLQHNGSFEEQKRHWWSNECPVFVAETCGQSLLIEKKGEQFDGTLRAGFALRRRRAAPASRVKKSDGSEAEKLSSSSSSSHAEEFEIDWLGCYWKLPKKPRSTGYAGELRDSIVSAARTSGTARVHPAQCQEIYAALGDLIPRLYCKQELRSELCERSRHFPGLPMYYSACIAASWKRTKSERQRAEDALYKAKSMLEVTPVSNGVRMSLSYVNRQLCSFLARSKSISNWGEWVAQHRQASLENLPTNANSWYINGTALLQEGDALEAEKPLLHSLLLDPDFKLAYVQLGICYLRQGKYDHAIATSEAGLERTPLPQFKYHLGLAHAQFALQSYRHFGFDDGGEVEGHCGRALEYLIAARQSPEARKQSKGQAPWTREDSILIDWLQMPRSRYDTQVSRLQDFRAWSKVGWPATSNRI